MNDNKGKEILLIESTEAIADDYIQIFKELEVLEKVKVLIGQDNIQNFLAENSNLIKSDLKLIIASSQVMVKYSDIIKEFFNRQEFKLIPKTFISDNDSKIELDFLYKIGANSVMHLSEEREKRQQKLRVLIDFWLNTNTILN